MNIEKLKKASKNFGTPLYVYDLSIIDSQLKKLKEAFKKLDNYQIHFAMSEGSLITHECLTIGRVIPKISVS